MKTLPSQALPNTLWNSKQAAQYIGVHVETLRRWVRRGLIPHIVLPGGGKDVRVTKEMIDTWVQKRIIAARLHAGKR